MLRPSTSRRRVTARRAVGVTGAFAAAALLPLALVPPAGAAGRTEAVGGPALASTGVVVTLGAGADPLPDVAAKSWVLADLDTGEVLAARDAHRRGRPASTMKTLTALTLMRVLDKDAVHVATWEEARADGGRVGIVPDAKYTVWDLYHGLLLPSGNDAAAALADVNGGMTKTVADMQATARELQASDTVVKNSSGLDADGMVTSAYDLALIARAALDEPQFAEVTSTLSYDFPGRPNSKGVQKTYKIYTQNRLLLHGYKGAIGGKTGFTSKAGRTFWGAAQRGDRRLVVTILQSTERTEAAAKALLTWGFANASKVTPVGTLVEPLSPQPQPSASPTSTPAPDAEGGVVAAPATSATSGSRGPAGWLLLGVAALAAVAGAAWFLRRRTAPDADPGAAGAWGAAGAQPTEAPDAPAVVEEPAVATPTVPEPPEPPVPAAAAPAPAEAASPAPAQPRAGAPASSGHVKVIAPPQRPPRG